MRINFNLKEIMAKILALDLGDQWVGMALSDRSGLIARPYTTIKLPELELFLTKLFKEEEIEKVIIGYPKTMKGTESTQTKKIVADKERLEKIFPNINFILWDERLSSKRAESFGSQKTKTDKIKSHALAAAFILDSYLSYLYSQNTN